MTTKCLQTNLKVAFFVWLCSWGFAVSAQEEKIDPAVGAALDQSDGLVPVIVVMRQAPLVPKMFLQEMTDGQTARFIKRQIQERQVEARELARDLARSTFWGEKKLRNYKFFWTVNAMMGSMDGDAIAQFAELDEVTAIVYDRRQRWIPSRNLRRAFNDFQTEDEWAETAETPDETEYTYGLTKLGIPQIREEFAELDGRGVRVGILDTGIDAKHPEFEGKTIIFKDFIDQKEEPYDDNEHGTHVAGTISGRGANGTQIGVAPGVTLIIGKMLDGGGSGTYSDILRSMEWIADPDGNPDTNDKPAVVNNSWGGSLGSDADADPFFQTITTWVQLDIFPAFAAGNSGPRRSSIGSPAGLPGAIAIGATDSEDQVAKFSSRGPVKIRVGGKIVTYTKPDISAPGHLVLSSIPGGEYSTFSGTSMATPHLVGVAALLYQLRPEMKVLEMRDLLNSTSLDLGGEGMDDDFGWGRADAVKAVQKASENRERGWSEEEESEWWGDEI